MSISELCCQCPGEENESPISRNLFGYLPIVSKPDTVQITKAEFSFPDASRIISDIIVIQRCVI